MKASTTAKPGRPKKTPKPDVAPIMNVRTTYSAAAHSALLAEQQRRLAAGLGKVPVADIQTEWLELAARQLQAGRLAA